jgi:hypothetical protein
MHLEMDLSQCPFLPLVIAKVFHLLLTTKKNIETNIIALIAKRPFEFFNPFVFNI